MQISEHSSWVRETQEQVKNIELNENENISECVGYG